MSGGLSTLTERVTTTDHELSVDHCPASAPYFPKQTLHCEPASTLYVLNSDVGRYPFLLGAVMRQTNSLLRGRTNQFSFEGGGGGGHNASGYHCPIPRDQKALKLYLYCSIRTDT